MDLGAGLCSMRNPSCVVCPLLRDCTAGRSGTAESYPVKPAKKAKPHRTGTAYWIERESNVWLVRRNGSGMLGGMRALPDDGWSARTDGSGVAPVEAEWRELSVRVAHVFTHFEIDLAIAVTAWPGDAAGPGEGEWWPVKSLDNAGLPTLFTKVAKTVIASGE